MTSTMQTGREVLATVRDAFIGRAAGGGRLFLTIELRRTVGPAETITHETTGEYLSVGISGGYVEPRSKRQDFDSCGQMVEMLDGSTGDRFTHWTDEDRASALAIWHRWHLNDMRAGCAHVPEPEWETDPRYGYRRPDLINTPACPVTGYRYGHGWLVDPLPADVADEVRRLCNIPRGKVPAWLG